MLKVCLLTLVLGLGPFFVLAQTDSLQSSPADTTTLASPANTPDQTSADTLKRRRFAESWKGRGSFGINFSQVSLSNWAGGGQSAISITGLVSLAATRQTEKSRWQNSLDLAYGQARQGGRERPFRKTDDQLIFQSAYNRRIFSSRRWRFNTSLDFRTQIDKGFRFETDDNGEEVAILISRFMAPAYLNTALGVGYKEERFSVAFSPFSSKYTFVLDKDLSQQGAYGVDPGKRVRSQVAGMSLQITADYELMTNIRMKTNFLAFSEYRDRLKVIDIFWENQFLLRVNKLFNATLTTNLIYDQDVILTRDDGTRGPATQFKSALNVGFLYKLP